MSLTKYQNWNINSQDTKYIFIFVHINAHSYIYIYIYMQHIENNYLDKHFLHKYVPFQVSNSEQIRRIHKNYR